MKSFNQFKQYLQESVEEDIQEIIDKAGLKTNLETVVENCSEYIRDVGEPFDDKRMLYRGMNESRAMEFKSIRKDRQPKDTGQKTHEKWDQYFDENYGLEWRSKSVQAKGSAKLVANDFGIPHVIFPVNGYHILWSEKVGDLTKNFNNSKQLILHDMLNNMDAHNLTTADIDQAYDNPPMWLIEQIMSEYDYVKGQTSKAVETNTSEIMIAGKGYYALDIDNVDDFDLALLISDMQDKARAKGIL